MADRLNAVLAVCLVPGDLPSALSLVRWGLARLDVCALGGIRTPNLLIRSQMLYPLSYERTSGNRRLSLQAGR